MQFHGKDISRLKRMFFLEFCDDIAKNLNENESEIPAKGHWQQKILFHFHLVCTPKYEKGFRHEMRSLYPFQIYQEGEKVCNFCIAVIQYNACFFVSLFC